MSALPLGSKRLPLLGVPQSCRNVAPPRTADMPTHSQSRQLLATSSRLEFHRVAAGKLE